MNYKIIVDIFNTTTGLTEFKNKCLAQGITMTDAEFSNTYDSLLKLKNTQTTYNDKKYSLDSGKNPLSDMLRNAMSGTSLPTIQDEQTNLADILETFMDGTSFRSILDGKSDGEGIISQLIGAAVNSSNTYIKQQTGLLDIVNKKLGLTGNLSSDFRDNIFEITPQLLAIGVGFDETTRGIQALLNEYGKFTPLNQKVLFDNIETAKAYNIEMEDYMGRIVPSFQNMGLGFGDVSKEVNKAGKGSLVIGIQASKTIKEIQNNLSKVNQYGFKAGVQGLSEMAKKSIEFRMNMNEVFNLADKVFNPDQALDLVANMQVLGGALGDLNDPLKLMYMATNNVEGLQEALFGAASTLATYNNEQGRFEITGVNLRRAKEMAQTLGVSYDELAKSAIAAQERLVAENILDNLTFKDDDEKRFLMNIAQMKGGEMVIELQSQKLIDQFKTSTIKLSELNDKQKDELLKYQDEFKQMSESDIVRDQFTLVNKISNDVSGILSTIRQSVGSGLMYIGGQATTGIDKSSKDFSKMLIENFDKYFGSEVKKLRKEYQEEETKSKKEKTMNEKAKEVGEYKESVDGGVSTVTHKHEINFGQNQLRQLASYMFEFVNKNNPEFITDMS